MNSQKGMTLLEVMFALAVLAIASAGMAAAFQSIERSNTFTNDRVAAFKSAHQTMETLLAMSSSDMIKYYDNADSGWVMNGVKSQNVSVFIDPNELDYGEASVEVVDAVNVEDYDYSIHSSYQATNGFVNIYSLDANWQKQATFNDTAKAFEIHVDFNEYDVHLIAVRTITN
ncbi:MAG: prepilin-type N-terminal cleavage/methylation domain-containing protein [Planctomycetes bacterium]|nr:prepilin-type N-terminal cleavage/methylation domain-containing protein [Planctomycetota bacterium]